MTFVHQFGEALRQYLQLVPLSAVRLLFVASLTGLLIWVIRLPRSATIPEGGVQRWDENLKIGASLALLIQILIYICL